MALPAYDNPKAGPPSPALSADDLSLSDMSLLTSPAGKPIPRSHQKSGSAERTSLVPITRSSGRNHVSSNDQSGCKLLQGIRTSSVGISGRSATAKNKSKTVQTRRFSLFPPSAVSEETRPVEAEEDDVTDASVLVTDEELRKLGLGLNASHLSGDTLDQRREPFEEQRGERSRQSSSQLSGTATRRLEPDLNPSGESREQKERQVEELAKMNSTFEAYERMLQGSAGQIELFSHRLSCTSELLSSYMDLLLRASDHHSLLLSPSWRGQTSDHELHVAELEKLKEQLEQGRRKRDQEEESERQQEMTLEAEAQLEAEEAKGGQFRTRGAPLARGTTTGRGRGVPAPRGRPKTNPAASSIRRIASRATTTAAGKGKPAALRLPAQSKTSTDREKGALV